MASKKRYEIDEEEISNNSNPFSFAKFVQQRETGSRNSHHESYKKGIFGSLDEDSDEEITISDISSVAVTPKAEDIGLLGETLQDSFETQDILDELDGNDRKQHESPYSFKAFMNKSKQKGKNSRILKIVNDELQEVEGNHVNHSRRRGDDNGASSDSDVEDKGKSDDSSCISPISAAYILPSAASLTGSEANLLQSNLYQLEQENMQLKQELEQLKEDMRDERLQAKRRIEDLVREVKLARRKEAEETAALERVVQMVEENLEKTTRRAVKAEATVSRQKEELKSFKENAVPRSLYDTVVEEYEHTLSSVREKSQVAAESMRKAATDAEPAIRKLLEGISGLQFLAEQFDDIDRITEISQHTTKTI